jgi:pyridine nucleotide-disulfide oxidoreductase family protein
MRSETANAQRLVLVGAGHAHAEVLRCWAAAPLPGVELVLVSPAALAPYSGMVPGWLAGAYRFDEICIDFAALAAAAGARFVLDEVEALDAHAQRLRLTSGAELGYTLLSLNFGSTLNPPPELAQRPGLRVLSLRPLGKLRAAWETLLSELAAERGSMPLQVTAVGGGAAGAESLLAVLARLRALQPGREVEGRLVTRSAELLPGLAPGAVRAMERELLAAGVQLQLGSEYVPPALGAASGRQQLLLWATGAEAHAWPAASGLAVGDRGFVRIGPQLNSVSHPNVYAVGDCAEWSPPLPKAGVYAVRMGPVLAHNLRAVLTGAALQTYTPQRRVLALLATGDGHAIAARGRWSASGAWLGRSLVGRALWRWKDRIDRRFLARFNLPSATTAIRPQPDPPPTPAKDLR